MIAFNHRPVLKDTPKPRRKSWAVSREEQNITNVIAAIDHETTTHALVNRNANDEPSESSTRHIDKIRVEPDREQRWDGRS